MRIKSWGVCVKALGVGVPARGREGSVSVAHGRELSSPGLFLGSFWVRGGGSRSGLPPLGRGGVALVRRVLMPPSQLIGERERGWPGGILSTALLSPQGCRM